MFEPVSSRVSFPEMEEKVLRFWKEKRIFEKSVEQHQGSEHRFILYEGPPTANGNPGLHHVLARVFKDLFPRYKTMQGFYAPRNAGWDCHGLPVELEVEKELGLSSKTQIEEYGIEAFNARCRKSVFRYLKDWEALTERIGYWLDMEHPYITLDRDYIESCWWIIKKLWDKGLIYQGHRVTPHCPRCVTSLSSHEVALGYNENAEDPSVYVKFRLTYHARGAPSPKALPNLVRFGRPVYLLAWTTTPWTLPANTALAVAPEAEYSLVEHQGEGLLLATALLGASGLGEGKVLRSFKGRDLVGLSYEPLYNPHRYAIERTRYTGQGLQPQHPDEDLTYPVIGAGFVSLDEGTGIVHIAPAYGEVDYEAGEKEGLDFLHTVDLQGKVLGKYPFSGLFVKDADSLIMDDLKGRGLLLKAGRITHTYPFCWRCNAPLLYYAKKTWFIRTTAMKEKLLEGNQEINWVPGYIKEGRFGDWLRNNVDWALSRERYWGTPLPIWVCDSGHYQGIGSLGELKEKAHREKMEESGYSLEEALKDPHRPFIDRVILRCPECQSPMHRVPEVIDCWFDSGAMPVAQVHYPFENAQLIDKDLNFPADYICEAVDQTRGWFYTLHALSTLLFQRPCFKNVICLGLILDAKGEKMSKARGNVVDPWAVIKAYGADALRWYMFTACPPGNVRRFDPEQVKEVMRQPFMTLWNTYSFFVTYANIDRFDPNTPAPPVTSELDRWIISELNGLIAQVTQHLDSYEPVEAGREIEKFIESLSNWYVRRSRRRFWKGENDQEKRSAYHTLYNCLVTLAKLMAPFAPFVAEELYQNLVRTQDPAAPESVHLSRFPVAVPSLVDQELMAATRLAQTISSLGRAARARAGIKVRQPLSLAYVGIESSGNLKLWNRVIDQVREEMNVKELKIAMDENLGYPDFFSKPDAYAAEMMQATGYFVAIDKRIPPGLKKEGHAREIVHRLQSMRKAAGFDIADHIATYYQAEGELEEVMREFAPYIQQETLSRQLVAGPPPDGAHQETHSVDREKIALAVKKL
ncbi:MAG: isoleucine--tRNA ligase [Chloroflexi bacterium]|nr:isoleucine--tRNA ligase [Chloroflexota bacterium]